MEKVKEPVRLREKKLKNGNRSLYLDIYTKKGERNYEFLKLYLIPEHNREDRERNKETLQLANSIKSRRIVELQNRENNFNVFAEDTLFFDYYNAICERHFGKGSRGNWGDWYSCLKHLQIYEKNKKIKFSDIDTKWVQGFRDYLDQAHAWTSDYRKRIDDHLLAKNTKATYFRKLKACLNQAFQEGVIPYNPALPVKGFKEEEANRQYLTIDEIRTLANTECEYPNIKRAFLFSCLTGLRRSDILNLTWGEIVKQGEFTRIIFQQKKTKGQEYLDISPQAAKLLGDRGKPLDHVFTDIHSPTCTNEAIKRWVLSAGIRKNITFHCGRHTFAVMMLDIGTDIYTVSKLLGHRSLATTQIYAKVLDKNKQKAVSNIPDVLGGMGDNKGDGGKCDNDSK